MSTSLYSDAICCALVPQRGSLWIGRTACLTIGYDICRPRPSSMPTHVSATSKRQGVAWACVTHAAWQSIRTTAGTSALPLARGRPTPAVPTWSRSTSTSIQIHGNERRVGTSAYSCKCETPCCSRTLAAVHVCASYIGRAGTTIVVQRLQLVQEFSVT